MASAVRRRRLAPGYRMRPASVSSTCRALRSKSLSLSSCSSLRICWLRGGYAICSRSAARPKCNSSATATMNSRRRKIETPHRYYDKRNTHPNVVVAGGGPAGMPATIAAGESGAQVMLVEHEHRLSGHLLWGSDGHRSPAAQLRSEVETADVEVITDSTVTGRYELNWTAIVQAQPPHRRRASHQSSGQDARGSAWTDRAALGIRREA